LLLTVRPDFAEAFAAVYRAAFTGLEGDFGIFTALGADSGVHLARFTAGAVPLGLPSLAAGGAALGLIGIAFGLEELLLRSAKGERRPTIGTSECLVLKSQRMTSFLELVGSY
jgi:hypothetical protein